MRIKIAVTCVLGLVLALGITTDVQADDSCRSNAECAPWEACSTSHGVCDSGDTNADVCHGTCVAGGGFRVIPRIGMAAIDAPSPATPDAAAPGSTRGASFGVEVVPPVLGGHLAVAVDYWTPGIVRAGLLATWAATPGLVLGLRADVTRATPGLGAMAAVRLDYFPWWQLPAFTPAHFLSLSLEVGAWLPELSSTTRAPFVVLALGIWL
ncbi:MAG: hypothetical protein M3680_12740 [Myxococcota bacterium]|nr:hypothetical protein [Myxococcota bacterium]